MKNKQRINTLLNTIKNNKEGFTLKYTTLKPYNKNVGSSVAITNIKSKKPLIAVRKVLSCIEGFKQIEKNLFIGGWFNSEDQYFYLDLSLILTDKKQIETIGFIFNQIAYFNFKTCTCSNFKKEVA